MGRRHAGQNIYHELEILADLAGGLAATLPFEKDFFCEETGRLLNKYIQRNPSIPAEHVHRCFRLIEQILVGDLGGVMAIAGVHGGGSPEMETITLMLRYPLDRLKSLAKYLAGLEPEFFRHERGTITPKQMLERAKKSMGIA